MLRPLIKELQRPASLLLPKEHWKFSVRAIPPKFRFMLPQDLKQSAKYIDHLIQMKKMVGSSAFSLSEKRKEIQDFYKRWGIEVPFLSMLPPEDAFPLEVRLPGGGAKGPLLMALMEALEEAGHKPLSWVGSSVGTIPATLGAFGMSTREMREAMKEFQNVLNMPYWEEQMHEALQSSRGDDSIDSMGDGLGLAFYSAGLTLKAFRKQGYKFSDPTRLKGLLRETIGTHIRRVGLGKYFKNPYNPLFREMILAMRGEPEAGMGFLSFPLVDKKNLVMIQANAFTMADESLLDVLIGAMAHPVLFQAQTLKSGITVFDGGASHNVGFPGFLNPSWSVAAAFESIMPSSKPSWLSPLTDSLQLGTKAIGMPYAIQHQIDDILWQMGAFGLPIPIKFDPKRISTTKEADPRDVAEMSRVVKEDARKALSKTRRPDPRLRQLALKDILALYSENIGQ